MSHTLHAQSRLAEAARLRQLATELDKGIDRRYGLFGYEAGSQSEALRARARQIEASVVIPVRQLPVIDIEACDAIARDETRRRFMTEAAPRMVDAFLDIERVTGGRIYFPRAAVRTAAQ